MLRKGCPRQRGLDRDVPHLVLPAEIRHTEMHRSDPVPPRAAVNQLTPPHPFGMGDLVNGPHANSLKMAFFAVLQYSVLFPRQVRFFS